MCRAKWQNHFVLGVDLFPFAGEARFTWALCDFVLGILGCGGGGIVGLDGFVVGRVGATVLLLGRMVRGGCQCLDGGVFVVGIMFIFDVEGHETLRMVYEEKRKKKGEGELLIYWTSTRVVRLN
jgi:hypothetical protein